MTPTEATDVRAGDVVWIPSEGDVRILSAWKTRCNGRPAVTFRYQHGKEVIDLSVPQNQKIYKE